MEQNPFKSGRYLCHELLESMITTISNHANSYLTSCCKHFLQSLATDHNISGFWINLSPARLQNPNKHDRKKQNIQKSDDVAVCKYNSNNNCPEKNFQLQSVCTKRIIKQKNLLSLPHSLQDDRSFIPHVMYLGRAESLRRIVALLRERSYLCHILSFSFSRPYTVIQVDFQFLSFLHDYRHGLLRWLLFSC